MKLSKETKIALIKLKRAWIYYQNKFGVDLKVERKYFPVGKVDDYYRETVEHFFLVKKDNMYDYTNPLTGEMFGFNSLAEASYFIIDANGKILKNADQNNFDLSDLDKLLYIED